MSICLSAGDVSKIELLQYFLGGQPQLKPEEKTLFVQQRFAENGKILEKAEIDFIDVVCRGNEKEIEIARDSLIKKYKLVISERKGRIFLNDVELEQAKEMVADFETEIKNCLDELKPQEREPALTL